MLLFLSVTFILTVLTEAGVEHDGKEKVKRNVIEVSKNKEVFLSSCLGRYEQKLSGKENQSFRLVLKH